MTCDFCERIGKDTPATIDGATIFGPWAGMCDAHHSQFGRGLGLGRGQVLPVEKLPPYMGDTNGSTI